MNQVLTEELRSQVLLGKDNPRQADVQGGGRFQGWFLLPSHGASMADLRGQTALQVQENVPTSACPTPAQREG